MAASFTQCIRRPPRRSVLRRTGEPRRLKALSDRRSIRRMRSASRSPPVPNGGPPWKVAVQSWSTENASAASVWRAPTGRPTRRSRRKRSWRLERSGHERRTDADDRALIQPVTRRESVGLEPALGDDGERVRAASHDPSLRRDGELPAPVSLTPDGRLTVEHPLPDGGQSRPLQADAPRPRADSLAETERRVHEAAVSHEGVVDDELGAE